MRQAPAFMAVPNTGNLDKKQLTEADIWTKFITPAIISSNWDLMTQIREEAFFTNGRVIVRGKTVQRGKAKKADYLLDYKPNYKVIRIGLDKDLDGWRPEDGQLDKYGNEIEDREYNDRDFDRNLILEKRTEVVASKITAFGTPIEIVSFFGGKSACLVAIHELETALYQKAA
jgi:type I site-specific restriction endonuclease